MTSTNIHQKVSQRYGEIAETGGASCCSSSEINLQEHAKAIGYSDQDLQAMPEGTNLGLGCGNPTSLTMIDAGMTVLDLGSGAGIDCFLAAKRVGPTGRVIGVDMTDEMLEKSRRFAHDKGYQNVEFRHGMIEQLPVDSGTVDLVISNCVINLSPDKGRVFGEIARVLKPGGRAAISDIVLLKPLPESILKSLEAYVGCIGGAVLVGEYLGHAITAGLDVQTSQRKGYDVKAVLGCSPNVGEIYQGLPDDFDAGTHIASLDLVAGRPAAEQAAPSSSCCCGGGDC